jgi:hypothetical protein
MGSRAVRKWNRAYALPIFNLVGSNMPVAQASKICDESSNQQQAETMRNQLAAVIPIRI